MRLRREYHSDLWIQRGCGQNLDNKGDDCGDMAYAPLDFVRTVRR